MVLHFLYIAKDKVGTPREGELFIARGKTGTVLKISFLSDGGRLTTLSSSSNTAEIELSRDEKNSVYIYV